jgi:enoyl-CoA hydratase/carnithine racemase
MSEDRVTVEIVDGVADVRLNRGDKMNAMDGAMFTALVETADSLAKTKGLRAVVLSGNGPAWCAGLDFSGFQAMAGDSGGSNSTADIGSIEEQRITHKAQQAVWG